MHNTYFVINCRFGISPFLLTPIVHPQDEAERAYNHAHTHTRVCIERAFGVLKIRFRCLHKSGGELTYSPVKCCKIIVACMVLHNMCMEANIQLDEEEDEQNDEDNNGDQLELQVPRENHPIGRLDGWQIRRQLINQRFM